MNVSAIGDNLLMSWNINSIGGNSLMPRNIGSNNIETEGGFASFLQGAMNSLGSISINSDYTSALTDLSQMKNISSLSNSEFMDMMNSFQSNLQSMGIGTSHMPDLTQMSDAEISSFKILLHNKNEQMQNMMASGGIFGIGNLYGSSETNPMQLFLDMLSSITSSSEGEEEELFPQVQIPQLGGSFMGMSTADYLSLRQLFVTSS